MTVKYLGDLSGPVLVFGGVYSNLQAIQALRQKADSLGISSDNCICTGDIVAYCANPVETVLEIRDWGVHAIQGNCEESLANNLSDCGCGFDIGSSCDLLSKQWYDFSTKALSVDDKLWMGELPMQLNFSLNGKRFQVIHGGVDNISRFIFKSTAISVFAKQFSKLSCDAVIAGHCGMPFTKFIGDKMWHNAGVIGMPANDGTPDVWYSLLTPQINHEISIQHYRLTYDFNDATLAMRHFKLAEGYARALTSGLWPSLDILPTEEKRQADITLNELAYSF